MNTLGATSPGLRAATDAAGPRAQGLEAMDESSAVFGMMLGALKAPAAPEGLPAADPERSVDRRAGDEAEDGTLPGARPEPANPLDLLAAVTPGPLPGAGSARMPVPDSLETLVARVLPNPAPNASRAAPMPDVSAPVAAPPPLPAPATGAADVPASVADSVVPDLRAGMAETLATSPSAPEARTRVTVLRRETHFAPVQPRLLANASAGLALASTALPAVGPASSVPAARTEPFPAPERALALGEAISEPSTLTANPARSSAPLPAPLVPRPVSSEMPPDGSSPVPTEGPQAAIVSHSGGADPSGARAPDPARPGAAGAPMIPGAEPADASPLPTVIGAPSQAPSPSEKVGMPVPAAPRAVSPPGSDLATSVMPRETLPSRAGGPRSNVPLHPETPEPGSEARSTPDPAPSIPAPIQTRSRPASPPPSSRPGQDDPAVMAKPVPVASAMSRAALSPGLAEELMGPVAASDVSADAPAPVRADARHIGIAARPEVEIAPTDRPAPEAWPALPSAAPPKAAVAPMRGAANTPPVAPLTGPIARDVPAGSAPVMAPGPDASQPVIPGAAMARNGGTIVGPSIPNANPDATPDLSPASSSDGDGTGIAARPEVEIAPTDRPVPEVQPALPSDAPPKAAVAPMRGTANALPLTGPIARDVPAGSAPVMVPGPDASQPMIPGAAMARNGGTIVGPSIPNANPDATPDLSPASSSDGDGTGIAARPEVEIAPTDRPVPEMQPALPSDAPPKAAVAPMRGAANAPPLTGPIARDVPAGSAPVMAPGQDASEPVISDAAMARNRGTIVGPSAPTANPEATPDRSLASSSEGDGTVSVARPTTEPLARVDVAPDGARSPEASSVARSHPEPLAPRRPAGGVPLDAASEVTGAAPAPTWADAGPAGLVPRSAVAERAIAPPSESPLEPLLVRAPDPVGTDAPSTAEPIAAPSGRGQGDVSHPANPARAEAPEAGTSDLGTRNAATPPDTLADERAIPSISTANAENAPDHPDAPAGSVPRSVTAEPDADRASKRPTASEPAPDTLPIGGAGERVPTAAPSVRDIAATTGMRRTASMAPTSTEMPAHSERAAPASALPIASDRPIPAETAAAPRTGPAMAAAEVAPGPMAAAASAPVASTTSMRSEAPVDPWSPLARHAVESAPAASPVPARPSGTARGSVIDAPPQETSVADVPVAAHDRAPVEGSPPVTRQGVIRPAPDVAAPPRGVAAPIQPVVAPDVRTSRPGLVPHDLPNPARDGIVTPPPQDAVTTSSVAISPGAGPVPSAGRDPVHSANTDAPVPGTPPMPAPSRAEARVSSPAGSATDLSTPAMPSLAAPARSLASVDVASPPLPVPPPSAPRFSSDGTPRDAVREPGAEPAVAMVAPETHGPIIGSARASRDGEPVRRAEPAPTGPAPVDLTNQPAPGAPGAPSPLSPTGAAQVFSGPPAQQVAAAILGQMPRAPSGPLPNAPGLDGPLRFLTLQLHPADLGIVQVRMRLRDGHLEMSLQASREETATLLREGGEVLADLLRQGGYQPERVTIANGPLPGGTVPEGQSFQTQGEAGGNSGQATHDRSDRRPPDGHTASDTSSERNHESVPSSPDRSGVYL